MSVCATCNAPITGKCVSALGKTYHPGHFLCHVCKQPITDKIIHQRGGKPICKQDFDALCPLCDVCHQPIPDDYIFFQDKYYHNEHFVCCICRKQIESRGYHSRKRKVVCHSCYLCKLAERCRRCGVPIEDRAVEVCGQCWHPGCFMCRACRKIIITRNYRMNDELEPICGECYAAGQISEYMATRRMDV